ncbi:MAG: RNA pseudouridine synthase, partial [Rhodospirillales bacterium]
HFAHAGHALIGDPVYGRGPRKIPLKKLGGDIALMLQAFPRQELHACELGFHHPIDGNYLTFYEPIPQDFNVLIITLDKS